MAEVKEEEKVYEQELNQCTDDGQTNALLNPHAAPFEATGSKVEHGTLPAVIDNDQNEVSSLPNSKPQESEANGTSVDLTAPKGSYTYFS